MIWTIAVGISSVVWARTRIVSTLENRSSFGALAICVAERVG